MSNEDIKRKIDEEEYFLKPKFGKSEIWKKFKQVFDKDDVLIEDVIACDNCHKVFRFNSHKTGTSTLLKHKCLTSSKAQGSSIVSFFKEKEKDSSSQKPPQEEKKVIIDKITKFVCHDLRSFNIIKGKGFQELAQSLVSLGNRCGDIDVKDILPDPTTISRNINHVAQNLRDEVKEELRKTVYNWGGAVTLDMWTEDFKKNSYLCMTIHYVDDNWDLIERVLHTTVWDSNLKKTGENIKSVVIQNLEKYGLGEQFQSLIYVTDRGPNMVAALKNNVRLSCIAHILNNILEKTMDRNTQFSDMINASKSLVKFFKQSGLQNKLTKTLKASVDTRWNSTFSMLKSIADVYSEVKELLSQRKEESKLIEIRQPCLLKLISFLEKFKIASDEIEATKRPTLFLVIIWYNRLLNHLEITDDDDGNFRDLKSSCLEIFKDTFEITKYHKMAIFFHPKMKSLKILDDSTETDSVHAEINNLISAYSKRIKDENINVTDRKSIPSYESMGTVSRKNPAKKQRIKYNISDFEDTDESDSEISELDRYIAMKPGKFRNSDGNQTDVLKWWHTNETKFPLLSKIAKCILSIPASSAASERDFSSAGLTLSDRRTNMCPKRLDDILFLHSNLKYHDAQKEKKN